MSVETAKSVARSVILPWKGLITIGVIVGLISLIEGCTAHVMKSGTTTAEKASCTVQSFDEGDDNSMVMNLRCNAEGRAKTNDAELAVAYLKKPGPLVCTLYQGAGADCVLASQSVGKK